VGSRRQGLWDGVGSDVVLAVGRADDVDVCSWTIDEAKEQQTAASHDKYAAGLPAAFK
jgi:hypothetical protein